MRKKWDGSGMLVEVGAGKSQRWRQQKNMLLLTCAVQCILLFNLPLAGEGYSNQLPDSSLVNLI